MNTNASGPVGSDSSEGLGGYDLSAILAFLDGSAPLDGVWFGEPHPTERGQFWWRKHLRAAAAVREPQTEELERAHEARRQAQAESAELKERMARVRLELQREMRAERVPLTDEQMAERNPYIQSKNHASVWAAGFRSAERAHGIKPPNAQVQPRAQAEGRSESAATQGCAEPAG